ncbi:MAG: hypothetical protein Q4D68_02310 [Moraxella equi]|nr:hypothetical protein [Moraxella equi]
MADKWGWRDRLLGQGSDDFKRKRRVGANHIRPNLKFDDLP